MKTKRKIYGIDEIAKRDFFDVFADAFTSPDCLALGEPDYGYDALYRDQLRISGDFRRAIKLLDLPAPEARLRKKRRVINRSRS